MLIGNPMIFRDLPFERAIDKMVEYGYDAVELWPPQIADHTSAFALLRFIRPRPVAIP